MKNLCAHADKNRIICIEKCCIGVEELSNIANIISKVLKSVEIDPKCDLNPGFYNKLIMAKNLSINIVSRLIALTNIVSGNRLAKEVDVSINTLCNLANSVVELENQFKEILDDPVTMKCRIIKENFEDIVRYLNYLGLKLCIIALTLLKNFKDIPSTYSGKIASSFASLLFASLLNIHNHDVKKALDQCFAIPT